MKNKEIKETVYKNVYQNASEGYVLTPSELAFEMVSTLPNEVFESDSTTFLDPICKSGTFLFEIVEKLYNPGHSIGNIEKRIYTIDSNSHSLNIANSYIKKILNKESGSFGVDFKSDFSESFFNYAVNVVSGGRFKTFSEFINTILIDKKYNYLMVQLKRNISEFIERYEKVSKLESKLFGEVFTPRQLIDEMLDTLPAEVWKNKDLKWLDPAVGIGNFPAAILDRLMVGLEDSITNEEERRKWILEEMLYMCDISIKNLFLLYKLFDENNEFKLNVYRGSFLTEDFDKYMKEVWGLEGFDVVVGNPPYQESSSSETKSSDQGRIKLWMKFINKSLIISINTLFITPNNWLSKTCYLNDIFKEKIVISEIDSNYLVSKYFKGVGSTFSYYLLSNDKKNENIIFLSSGDKIDSSIITKDLFPTKDLSVESISIFNKVQNMNIKNISFIREKYNKLDNLNLCISIDRSKNKGFVKSDESIFSTSNYWYICSDDKQMKILLNNLNTKLYKFLIKNIRSGMAIVSTINYLPIVDDKVYTDDGFYNLFNLTENEINYIKKVII